MRPILNMAEVLVKAALSKELGDRVGYVAKYSPLPG